MDYYRMNLQVLMSRYPELAEKVDRQPLDTSAFTVVRTKSGDYTLKVVTYDLGKRADFFLHSKYNPIKEAEEFVKKNISASNRVNIIYGFGLGYHVVKTLEIMGPEAELYVVEQNLQIFKLALTCLDFVEVLKDGRLRLIIDGDYKSLARSMRSVLKDGAGFYIYNPSVKAISEEAAPFKLILEKWNMPDDKDGKWNRMMEENLSENSKYDYPNIGMLFKKYRDIPIIIVSSGPSLNKNKHLLKDVKGKALIFCAGSALKPLMEAEVEPDAICIIDPHKITYAQISGYEELDIPLIFLDTASHFTVNAYKGPKFIACNDETRINNREYLISSGGSVATAILDMAIKLGGNPIAFVGQDLAYTDNKHHADGRMYGEKEDITPLPNMRKVKGQNGEILNTTLGLLTFKNWIENKIMEHPEIEFINATEGGAFIEGCKHMTLNRFIEEYVKCNSRNDKVEELIEDLYKCSIKKN